MVNLTRPAYVRLSPFLSKAEDLKTGRGYGRKNIAEKDVPFLEKLPLSLKNVVANKSSKGAEKACMDPMMEVIACLSKYDQNQSMCSKEIGSFEKCFKTFKITQEQNKAFSKSGELPIGPRAKMNGVQLTKYMKNMMPSQRKGEFLPNSAYGKK